MFKGKVVVVTGANRGIGKAIADHFFDEGARVVYAVRNEAACELPVGPEVNGRAIAVACDVTDERQIAAMFERVAQTFGPVSVLVNNAGVDQPCALDDITIDHLEHVWRVNVTGVILCTKYAARSMRAAQRGGAVINLSSIAGKEGNAYHTAYVASKHAVIGITRSNAMELLADGIRVNAVCPGLIDTDMLRNFFKEYAKVAGVNGDAELGRMVQRTPLGRMGSPLDVAHIVGFLASDKAANIVGQAINTDGGFQQF